MDKINHIISILSCSRYSCPVLEPERENEENPGGLAHIWYDIYNKLCEPVFVNRDDIYYGRSSARLYSLSYWKVTKRRCTPTSGPWW